jgi:hypothetical protein
MTQGGVVSYQVTIHADYSGLLIVGPHLEGTPLLQ